MQDYKTSFLFIIHFFFLFSIYSQNSNKKTNTSLADSLDLLGEYSQSLKFRSLALKENDHTTNFKKTIEVKYHYTQSCIYEAKGGQENHRKALVHSIKAREISKEITSPTTDLKHHIANRIYHQYGYVQNWRMAQIEAQEYLKIVLDTLPEHHAATLLIFDDLGFINNKLGDYINSLKYYDKASQLYVNHHPDNKRDPAMNYSRMANNYKRLGMRQKEFIALEQCEKLWRETSEDISISLFSLNSKFSSWYLDYGNYELAETYLNRQAKFIDSIKHKAAEFKHQRRSKYLALYKNYIDLFFEKKDFVNAKVYINLSEIELKESSREFIADVVYEAAIYVYNSKLPEKSSDESLELLKKAVNLITVFKDDFSLDPTGYKIELFKKYKDANRLNDAELVLKELIENYAKDNPHELFYLHTNYADLLSKKSHFSAAKNHITQALQLYLLKDEEIDDSNLISINQIKPFYSFESIDGFLIASNYYLKQFINSGDKNNLQKAQNLSFLAADIFNNLYLGDHYNDTLYEAFKKIEKSLLHCLKYNASKHELSKTLEAIERSTSKLTWSKFLYSKHKQNLNIPDTIVNRENELKSLINYYQRTLYSQNEKVKLENDTIKSRITDLNLDLSKLQNSIKTNYSNYYNRNFKSFEVSNFQKTIATDNLIVKYIFSEDKLYCFTISKDNLGFKELNVTGNIKNRISNYIKKLSSFNSEHIELGTQLQPLISDVIDGAAFENITIIPDHILNYLPFESLMTTYQSNTVRLSKHAFSYSTSLTLLSEQNTINSFEDHLNIGVFSTSNATNNELPSVINESKNVLNQFDGMAFDNLSKSQFLEKAKDFNVLHLAMHSNINNETPEFSSLEFGKDRLLMSELYNETFMAQLAVLSACETGGGNFVNGEGVQSISKAFTYTGIPSTVLSLWKVDDEATSKIMTAFYKHLKDGKAKDIALKNAKEEYLNTTNEIALKHPYYWAGFIVSGNTSPLINSTTNVYLYIGILLLIVLAFLFRKRLQFFK